MIDAILLDRIHPERIKNKTTDSSDFTDFKDDGTTPVAAIEWNRQHPPHSNPYNLYNQWFHPNLGLQVLPSLHSRF
jgi:hypothetical protein